MSNIDMSRLIPADARAADAADLRARTLRAACRVRIFAVADQITQTNLATAFAAGKMSQNDADGYSQLLGWIEGMRTACRTQIDARAADTADTVAWPDLPAPAAGLARRF